MACSRISERTLVLSKIGTGSAQIEKQNGCVLRPPFSTGGRLRSSAPPRQRTLPPESTPLEENDQRKRICDRPHFVPCRSGEIHALPSPPNLLQLPRNPLPVPPYPPRPAPDNTVHASPSPRPLPQAALSPHRPAPGAARTDHPPSPSPGAPVARALPATRPPAPPPRPTPRAPPPARNQPAWPRTPPGSRTPPAPPRRAPSRSSPRSPPASPAARPPPASEPRHRLLEHLDGLAHPPRVPLAAEQPPRDQRQPQR